MAQARVPVRFMFIQEHMSRMELQALGCLPRQQSEKLCASSASLSTGETSSHVMVSLVKQWCVRSHPAVARDLVAIGNF